jgi:transcription elongation factor GreB
MSRGFVKEDDQEEIPFVAPRAHLPAGAINYVTPKGMEALLAEKRELLLEKDQLEGHNENDRRIAVNHINARLELLEERIYTARVINLEEQPAKEIRFGATIDIKNIQTGETQTLQITGVDEADMLKGKLSFLSPLARLLNNKKVGDKVVMKKIKGENAYQVLKIEYIQ